MYGSLGSLMVLLLLIGVCTVLLLRIERFDNPVTGSDATAPSAATAPSDTGVAPSGSTGTPVPTPSDGTASQPSDLLAILTSLGIGGTSLQQGNSFQGGLQTDPSQGGLQTDPSQGGLQTDPSQGGLQTDPSQGGQEEKETQGSDSVIPSNSTNPTSQSSPADAQVAQLQQQVSDLQEQNKQQQSDINMYQERQRKQKRCPDISQYIRKDSIPCYNCTL
jgi:hypothetical protein